MSCMGIYCSCDDDTFSERTNRRYAAIVSIGLYHCFEIVCTVRATAES